MKKNLNSQQNLVSSWQEQIQKIKLLNYYTEKDKKYLDKLSSLRQEPTFKTVANKRCMIFFPFLSWHTKVNGSRNWDFSEMTIMPFYLVDTVVPQC